MTTAEQLGFVKPVGTDLISTGDNDISTNADASAAMYDTLQASSTTKANQALADAKTHAEQGDATVLQAAKDDATQKANAAKWPRGILPNGTNYQTELSGSGFWYVTTKANADTMVPPLPAPGAGILTREEVSLSGAVTLEWKSVESGTAGQTYKMDRLGSTFTEWMIADGRPREIPLDTDLHTFRSEYFQGSWHIYNTADALTIVNRPPFTGGFYLDVKFFDNITWLIAYPAGDASQRTPMVKKFHYFPAQGWTDWAPFGGMPRELPLNTDLHTFRSEYFQGSWYIYATSDALTIVNRPPFTGGFYLDVKFFNNITWLIAYPAGDASQRTPMAKKFHYFPAQGWTDWEPFGDSGSGGGSGDVLTAQSNRHAMLKQRNRLGHGGVIGVGEKVAVGLSFDHGFANYRDILLPHLTRLGLPHAAAVNTTTLNTGESAGVSYPQLQDWAINKGLVLSNHGRSHADATTEAGMEDMILGSLDLLHANCPKTIVDTFIAPGTSGTGFNGFGNGMDDYTKWWTHPAGRIMIDNHASVTAGLYGMALPLDGEPIQSMDRVGFDYGSQATAIQDRITALQGTGMGIQIFNHPSLIDATGYITTARVVSLLEWLAAERDAGRVEILSSAGFAWARSGTEKRHDLIAGQVWSSGSLTFQLAPLYEWARGYHRQLAVISSAAADVTLTVTDDTGLLNTTVTQTVAAGGMARLNFGIPTDSASLTFTASSTAGTLSGQTVYAI